MGIGNRQSLKFDLYPDMPQPMASLKNKGRGCPSPCFQQITNPILRPRTRVGCRGQHSGRPLHQRRSGPTQSLQCWPGYNHHLERRNPYDFGYQAWCQRIFLTWLRSPGKSRKIIVKKSLWPNKENPITLFMRILLSNLTDCSRKSRKQRSTSI